MPPLSLSHHPLEEARCHVVTTLKLLTLIHQWADSRNNYKPTASRTKTMIAESNMITWITALCNSMKLWVMPCRVPHDRWGIVESSDKKGMANHSSPLALGTPQTVWKGKKRWHWETSLTGWKVSNMLLRKSREIAPERTKRLSQSGNDVLWWLCLVGKAKSDAAENNTARQLVCSSIL